MCQLLQNKQLVPVNCDWDDIRPIFAKMYQDDGMKLRDIMAIMSEKYGFDAPVHMYKKRITQWGLGKSFTSGEKAKYANIAQKRLAAGQSLPLQDELGRNIPWDRVRRQEGRQAIPTKVLPRHLRKQRHELQIRSSNVATLTSTNKARRTTKLDTEDDVTELAVAPAVKSPIPLTLPSDMRRLEHMFYYVQCYYSWHGHLTHTSTSKSTSDVGSFYNIYFDAFHKLTHCSSTSTSRLAILSTASKAVAPVLRRLTIDLLNALLSIIIESIQCVPITHTLALITFFAASSHQELGPYNPLTILLQAISEQACRSTTKPTASPAHHLLTNIPFIQLMEDAVRQIESCTTLRTSKTDASYNAQWIHIYFLLRVSQTSTTQDQDKSLRTAREAENACHRLVSRSNQVFGPRSSQSMRAKIGLAQAMWLQGRHAEARFVLECVWKAWISRASICGFPTLEREMDWCPAKQLADIHDLEGDLAAARYYGSEAFEWAYFRHGPGDGETLHLLAKQIERLEAAGNYTHRDRLMQLYPVACQLLLLYRDDNSGDVHT